MTTGGSSKPIFIAGPTAVGKSSVALWMAERLHGEIISVDSMQVYRGMDIGTAKPSAAEQARIPHHLIDVADPGEGFNAARFCTLARGAMGEVEKRGRRPIFCGGTGLYFKAWLEGLGEAPPSDAALREVLSAIPVADLLMELGEKDPETWDRIDRQNPRRVIRAVEVIRLTGRPFSTQRAARSALQQDRMAGGSASFFYLTREPADLFRRIATRVDAMFSSGWVDETRGLLKRGLATNPAAMQAIGYRQIVEWLGSGGEQATLAALVELVKLRTRQYARRQGTWFRRQSTARVMLLEEQESPARTGGQLLQALQ